MSQPLPNATHVHRGPFRTFLEPQPVQFARLAKLALSTLMQQNALFALRDHFHQGWDVRMRKGSMITSMVRVKWWQRSLPRATPSFAIMHLTIRCICLPARVAVYVGTGPHCRLSVGHATLARTLTRWVLVAVHCAQRAPMVTWQAPHHALHALSMLSLLQAVPK